MHIKISATITSHMDLITKIFGFPHHLILTFSSSPYSICSHRDPSEIWIQSSYSSAWYHPEIPHRCCITVQTLIQPTRSTYDTALWFPLPLYHSAIIFFVVVLKFSHTNFYFSKSRFPLPRTLWLPLSYHSGQFSLVTFSENGSPK